MSPNVGVKKRTYDCPISFRIPEQESKQQDQEEDICIARVVQDGFTAASEWQQAEIMHYRSVAPGTSLFPRTAMAKGHRFVCTGATR